MSERELNKKVAEVDETVEERIGNATDFALIDAAARAWLEAGGDADGVEFCWHHIRDRVGELA